MVLGSPASARVHGANGDEVFVLDRAQSIGRQRDESLRAPRGADKLDLQDIRRRYEDNGTQISGLGSVLRKVSCQDDGVEFPIGHRGSPGYTVFNLIQDLSPGTSP